MEQNYFAKVEESKKYLAGKVSIKPEVMIVLSGGLTEFVEKIEDPVTVLASEIPNFPKATAEGHSGQLIFGTINGVPLVALKGRFHFYEGHDMGSVIFPVFALNALGAKKLILTNATGGINESFNAGDIMMITDHINFMGTSPLRGIATQRKEDQFSDMTNAYSKKLQGLAKKAATEVGIDLKEGVYIATAGPNYETKAEIKMFRAWGADSVR